MAENPKQNAEPGRDLLKQLLTRGRAEASKAAKKGREMLHLRQLRVDRDRMYQKLGKEARNLLEGGEIAHPGIARAVERIAEIEARITEQETLMRAKGDEPEPEPPAGG